MSLHNRNTKHDFDKDEAPISFILFLSLVVIFIAILTMYGCRTSKEQKQIDATNRELAALQALRLKYPCDTATQYITIRDTAVIFTTDTSYIPRSDKPGSKDTVYITRYKTITHNVEKIVKVVDQAAIQAARDSLWIATNLFSNCTKEVAPIVAQNTALKSEVAGLAKWRAGVLIGAGLLILSIIGSIALKIYTKAKNIV